LQGIFGIRRTGQEDGGAMGDDLIPADQLFVRADVTLPRPLDEY